MISKAKRLAHRLSEIRRSTIRRFRRASPVVGHIRDCRIVFIIASPRSGTTWLQKTLNEHPQITCGENRLFGSYFDVVADGSQRRLRLTVDEFARGLAKRTEKQQLHIAPSQLTDELTAEFARVVFSQWHKHSGKPILVDKVTPYPGTAFETTSKIRQFFPNAKIIQLVRDGRDVATSGTFHWLQKSLLEESTNKEQRKRYEVFSNPANKQRLTRFFTDSDLKLWAETWTAPIQAVTRTFDTNLLRIRYEDMIENLSTTMEAICHYIEAESTASILNKCVKYSSFERMSGGRSRGQAAPLAHVRKGVVGDWKNYFTLHDGKVFQNLCGNLLQDLSYEKNPDWALDLSESLCIQEAA